MPPSYQSWLYRRTPDQLAALLHLRPDTALPVPPTVGSLATRLRIRSSVARALRELSAAELAVAEAAADAGAEFRPVARREVAERVPQLPAEEALAALDRLEAAGLVYGEEGEVILLKEVFASLPPDWKLLHEVELTDAEIARHLDSLDAPRRAMLETLANSAGMGLTRDDALVESGLVVRVDERTVRLPLSVRRALRGASPARVPLRPPQGTPVGDPRAVDEAGVAAGLDAVRLTAQLLHALERRPLPLLRAGGVGVRETRRLARDLRLGVDQVKRLVCLSHAAGLVTTGEPDPLPAEGHSYLAPTGTVDAWFSSSPARRLETLAAGWLRSRWAYWDADRLLDEEDPRLPTLRRALLAPYLSARVSLTEEEAEWIGALAGGAASVVARRGAPLDGLIPATVDRVILQADMTALAPGPLEYQVEAELNLMAHLESPGLASVYRFSEDSVRQALDAGRSGGDLLAFLRAHALGEVPQALAYLIEDMGSHHGALRGGAARCYLRCEDPAALQAAVLASASLRALAPTVAISERPLGEVMEELRGAGFHPAAEDAAGLSIDIRPEPARIAPAGASTRSRRQAAPQLTDERIRAIVERLLSAEETPEGEPTNPKAPEDHVSTLSAAARGRRLVDLGYVDARGTVARRRLKPLRVTAGQVDAVDPATGTAHRLGLHRVTSVDLVP
ncbi:helicase-associated domain-containing protein [Corynebacterium mastitidis]